MKDIFSKDNLPLIERVGKRECTPRENWELMAQMHFRRGMTDQSSLRLLLLVRGAEQGDPWSMCQLARAYYDLHRRHPKDGNFLPLALSHWCRAARLADQGALSDLKDTDLLSAIFDYTGRNGEYADREMKCAMLSEYILRDMGQTVWESLTREEKTRRLSRLMSAVCERVLGIGRPALRLIPELSYSGGIADGLAQYGGALKIRLEVLDNYPRLIQVLFHELGHYLVFAMWNGADPKALALREIYGITEERAAEWYRSEKKEDEAIPPSEQDPDTLSYGVYTASLLLFE